MIMSLIEQAIQKCHMTHKYENPWIENGMCAGLRTMNGEGEPPEECKECKLYYGYADEHDIKKTNADRIRSMSVYGLANFLSEVKKRWNLLQRRYGISSDYRSLGILATVRSGGIE